MKLYEVEGTSDNLVLLLRNMVTHANSQQQPSFLSWSALSNLMQNMDGDNINYDSFKSSYDSNPEAFKTLVQNYDARGITLKTQKKEVKQGDQAPGAVAQMAKSATARRQG
jgi:hypothetical protein